MELDNADSSVTTIGSWTNSTSSSGYLGTNYQYMAAGSGNNSLIWNADISTAGEYQVYARWTSSSNRASNAPYTINHANGSDTVTANQKQNGGLWNLLGTYSFNAGVTSVSLSDNADAYVIADGIKMVPIDAAPNTATWALSVPEAGEYTVYARWASSSNHASNAQYTVFHSNGDSTITMNQKQNGGIWNAIGTFQLDTESTTVNLTDVADGYVIADAIKLVAADAPPNSANWALDIPETGNYKIYARWSASSNRASNASYTVSHSNGETTVALNQKQNGGIWNLIGSYDFTAGQTEVKLIDVADGYVIADSIKLVAADAPPNSVTWNPNLLSGAEYEVYARWSAGSNRATNAHYSIIHANGSETVSSNQTSNGGQWNLLGTYTLNSESHIALTDQADGYVIADAIKLLPTGNSVTTSGGIYYIHTDHLDTPKLMTDAMGEMVWSSAQTPFGQMLVDEDPDGNGETVSLNFRFPGQYFDGETGLYYNYHRYYDPSLGRYITSDPIGLDGGLNTYGYVESNPLNLTDIYGLASFSMGFGGGFHYGPGGANASTSIGIDTNGKVCMQFTKCGQVGFGLQGGLGVNASMSKSNFCEGDSSSEGLFGEGAIVYGGGVSASHDSDGNVSGSAAKGIIGAGTAAGKQFCTTRTVCFN